MITPAMTSTMGTADSLAALSRVEVERRGRWQSFRRALVTVLALAVVLVPLYLVDAGRLAPRTDPTAVVTGRLTVLGEIVLARYYFQFVWRCGELVRSSRAPRGFQRLTTVMLAVLGVASLLVVIEKLVMWGRLEAATSYPVDLFVVPGAGWVHLIVAVVGWLVMIGLALTSSPGFWWKRDKTGALVDTWRQRLATRKARSAIDADAVPRALTPARLRWRAVLENGDEERPPPPPGGTIICCSGGGMRSASFCLGGLQQLQRVGIYQRAAAVVGVSGGGYVAAAMHVLRWQSRGVAAEGPAAGEPGAESQRWAELDPPPFTDDSPEFNWLRRHSRFLFDSPRVATLAAMSILFGMAVNLFWCAVALGVLAWWLGWFYLASGGLILADGRWQGGSYLGGEPSRWNVLDRAWLLPLAGLGIFALERFFRRLAPPPTKVSEWWRSIAVVTSWIGLAATLLFLGLPRLMALAHHFPTDHPGSVWSTLVAALGLAPAGPTSTQTTSVSLAAVAAAILAVVRASLAKIPGETAGRGGQLVGKLFDGLRRVVLPWLALLVILVAALVLLMTWIWAFMSTTGEPNWDYVYVFSGVAVILTLFTDANWTSLHHFYRERLSYAFLVERISRKQSRPLPYKRSLRFSDAAPGDGGPELVTCAVANVSDAEYVPADRRATPFVFDQRGIGMVDTLLPSGRRMPAPTYEFAADFRLRDATIPAAMAMSGAAFSPLVGREHRRVAPYRLILALANARLGVWLPNPIWADEAQQVRRMVGLREQRGVVVAWRSLPEKEQSYLAESVFTSGDRLWLAGQLGLDPRGEDQSALPVHQLRDLLGSRRSEARDEWLLLSCEDRQALRDDLALRPALDWLGAERVNECPETFLRRWDNDVLTHQPAHARAWWRRPWEMVRGILNQPGPYRLFKEGLGRPSLMDRRLYVTDGGHYDNLDLVEALRRRARHDLRPGRVQRRREHASRTLGRGDGDGADGPGLRGDIDPTPDAADGEQRGSPCAGRPAWHRFPTGDDHRSALSSRRSAGRP